MRKILILFSDTGGGHRAAAQAIRDALNTRFREQYETVLVDGIVEGATWPFNLVPKTYRPMVTYAPWGWGFLFNSTNSRWGKQLAATITSLTLTRGLVHILARHNPDLLVTVHPLLTRAPWRVWKNLKPGAPFVTVVTDLFDAHATWFSAPADLLIVPTAGAMNCGAHWGFPKDRMCVVGLPVGQQFSWLPRRREAHDDEPIAELRERLGLVPDRFTILIVGGGEGMGKLEAIARALANTGLPVQLAVIAGRNARLKKKLESEKWSLPVRVAGFVTNMPEWMRASDLVVTKAGPQTIMEALTTRRPLLLSGYLPGQEKGNVDFVLQSGVGVLCEEPEEIAVQVREWLSPGNQALNQMRERAMAAARPDAADRVADLLTELIS